MSIICPNQTCPMNGNVSLKFETDAEDSYFDEHVGLGQVEFSHDDLVQRSKLRTGIYTLTIKPSLGYDHLHVGQKINLKLKVKERKKERFSFDIPIEITEAIPESTENTTEKIKRGPNIPYTREVKSDPNSKLNQSLIDPPEFKSISREKNPKKWQKFFRTNDKRGAFVDIKSDGKVTFWVNISHPSLIHYQNRYPDLPKKRLIDKYVHYIGFQTWGLHLIIEGKKIPYPDNYSPKTLMEATADALAFFGLGYVDAAR